MRGVPCLGLLASQFPLSFALLSPLTDFWNFSKYSWASVFSFTVTLLCMVASALRIGARPLTASLLTAMVSEVGCVCGGDEGVRPGAQRDAVVVYIRSVRD